MRNGTLQAILASAVCASLSLACGSERPPSVVGQSAAAASIAPDFVITQVQPPASVLRGSGFDVSVTVCNRGTGGGSTPVDLVLSADSTLSVSRTPQTGSDALVGGGSFSLAAGACETRLLPASAVPPGSDGAWYVGAIADVWNGVPELNETNNRLVTGPIGIGSGPDFVVRQVKGPPTAARGASFTASVTVCNQGTAAGAAPVELILSADSTIAAVLPPKSSSADRVVGEDLFQLQPGACETRAVPGYADPPGSDGAFYLGAIADFPGTLRELVETNNASAGTLIGIGYGPDLVVKEVKGPASVLPGASFTASVTACNQGTAPATAPVELILSTDATIRTSLPITSSAADRPVGNRLFQLQPGACATQELMGTATPPSPVRDGPYYLGAIADLPGGVRELIESNNASAGTLIGIGSRPDLIVKEVKGPPSAMRGDRITASVTVCNQGTAPGAAPVELVASADSTIEVADGAGSAADRVLGSTFFAVQPGACETQPIEGYADAPGPDGAYYLGAIADRLNVLPELVETNNTLAGNLTGIGTGADLVVREVKGPASALRGGLITATVTVCNQGTSSGFAPVALVLSADATLALSAATTADPAVDRLIGATYFQVDPGACQTQIVPGFADDPGPDGAYFLGAIADYTDSLPELIETNNANPGSLIGIGSGPDLVVREVRGPASASRGATFTASVTVCNQGTVPGSAPVHLVLSANATIDVPVQPNGADPTADQVVGDALVDLQAGACATRDLQAYANAPGPDGAYILGAIVDLPRGLPELIETNNATTGPLIGIGNAPDWVITSVKGPPSAAPGSAFTASVTICNQGTAPGSAPVDLLLSTDPSIPPPVPPAPLNDAVVRLAGASSVTLPPSACETQQIAGTALPPGQALDGTYYLSAVVDRMGSLLELNASNNLGPATPIGIGMRPDFVVTAVKGPPSAMPGTQFTTSVTVCNRGTAAGVAPVDLVLSADADIDLPPRWDPNADQNLGSLWFQLQPGACATQDFAATVYPFQGEGAYYLGAVADVANGMPELIETNNTAVGDLIGLGWGPDLVVREVKGPASVARGGAFTATVTVCNQGTASGVAWVDLVLSADATLLLSGNVNLDAVRLAGTSSFQLDAGACQTQSVRGYADAPGPDGAYFLGAIADLSNSLPELIETNNGNPGSPIGIGSGPDLVVREVKVPPSASRGATFTVSVTVCNQGTVRGAAPVDFFLSSDPTYAPPPVSDPWSSTADQLIGNVFFDLAAGACATQDVQVVGSAPGNDGGYYLGAIVDLPHSLPELIESNNTSPGTLIGIGNAPDLVITDVKGPPSAIPGSAFTASVTICNQGTASGTAPVDLLLSTTPSIALPVPPAPLDDAVVRLVGNGSVTLQPKACTTQQLDGAALPPGQGLDGTYYLSAVVDRLGGLVELIASNNLGPATPIGIGMRPDFVVTSVKGPPSAMPGAPFTTSITVCNYGTGEGYAPVDLILSSDADIGLPSIWDPNADQTLGNLWFQLQPGACASQDLSAYAYPLRGDGAYFLGAVADLGNGMPELIETNNTAVGNLIGIGWGADLVVQEVKGPASVLPGAPFTASITACNQGTAAGGAWVDLVLSSTPTFPLPIGADSSSAQPMGSAWFQLEPGACKTQSVQAYGSSPSVDGAYYLSAVADDAGILPELIETNNLGPATMIGIGWRPDFVVKAIKGPPSAPPNGTITASVTVCNQGTASGTAPVDLFLSADATYSPPPLDDPWSWTADRLIGNVAFDLAAGACETRDVQVIASAPGFDGAYYLGAVADRENVLPELIETNNVGPTTLIGIGQQPDLVVKEVKGPQSVQRGQPFSALVTVCNQGLSHGEAEVQLYLSLDATITPVQSGTSPGPSDDQVIGSASFGLDAGACATQSIQGSANPPGPWIDGAFYLGAVADGAGWLPELIESNNASAGSVIGVGNAPDLVVQDVKVPQSVRRGEPFIATVTVCNQGTAPGWAPAELVLSADARFTVSNPPSQDPAADRSVGSGYFYEVQPGGCETEEVQGYADPPGSDGAWFVGVIVDPQNGLPELIETNNASTGTLIGIGWGPDLVVRRVQGPPSALLGSSFTASVEVCNQGTAPGSAPVDLVLSSDSMLSLPSPSDPWSSDGDRLVGSGYFNLQPGACETQEVQGYADPPSTGSAVYLGAVVDPMAWSSELVASNDASPATLIGIGTGPDLVVKDVTAPSTALRGASLTVSVTVCNQGTAAGGAPVDLFLSTDPMLVPPRLGSWDPNVIRPAGNDFFQLQAGACETREVQATADAPGVDGVFSLGAVVDLPASLPELIEENNVSPAALIAIGSKPDLVVRGVQGPASIVERDPFLATVTVCNQGTAAGAAYVDLVLSLDSTIAVPVPPEVPSSSTDRQVGGDFFQLQPGACETRGVEGYGDPPGMSGDYFLGAQANVSNTLAELIETNNASAGSPIHVAPRPQ